MMTATGKSLEVKDWMANKIAKELGRNISCCDVFAILKETEKAYYAMLNLGCDFARTTWIPKSAVIEHEPTEFGALVAYHETYRCDDWNEALTEFKSFWNQYK